MRELLIRYLLGELDAAEQQEVQHRLAANAELRRELAHLRSCFAAACQAGDAPPEPPPGLAQRTTDHVAGGTDGRLDSAVQSASRGRADMVDPPAGTLGWSLADLTVAGGVILAVSMLLFPALRDSRDGTRRNVCQNNQRQLWVLVAHYAQNHGDFIPRVEPNENAGMFAVRLAEEGYISREDLAVLLVCPGAPLADAIRSGQFVMRVPSSAELRAMSPSELAIARRNTSPFLAYRFPYRVGQNLYYIRHEPLNFSPWFSDTAGAEQDGLMSPNHGGSIVQVMNQDGNLKSLTTCVLPGLNDNLFRNALGKVAAGLGRQDSVLGGSEATPGIIAAARGQ